MRGFVSSEEVEDEGAVGFIIGPHGPISYTGP